MSREEEEEVLVYTVGEAAKLLRLGRGSMYEAVRTGRVPSVRIGRRILIPCEGLKQLLQQNPVNP